MCGRADLIRDRFAYWRNYVEWGARTAFETQDVEARSDCHAWSACPLYFMHTVFAGVAPASPFFRTVRVAPQPAGMTGEFVWRGASVPLVSGVNSVSVPGKDGASQQADKAHKAQTKSWESECPAALGRK